MMFDQTRVAAYIRQELVALEQIAENTRLAMLAYLPCVSTLDASEAIEGQGKKIDKLVAAFRLQER